MADSYTGNHPEDDFTPLETIQRSHGVIGKRIPFELEGEAFEPESRVRHHFPTMVLMLSQSSREKMIDSQMDDMIKEKLVLKQQIDLLEQNLSKQIKEKESLLQTFTVFKNESREKESKNMENEIDLEKKIEELDNIVYKVGQSAQTMHISVISSKHVAMSVIDDDETLILEEISRSKMLAKQNDPISKEMKVNTTPIKYVELNKLSEDFGKRFVPQQEFSAEQAFWLRMSNPTTESSNASHVKVESPSKLSKVSLVNASLKKLKFHIAKFDSVVKIRTAPDALTEELLNELTEVQIVFNQMEVVVQQCAVFKDQFDSIKKTRVRTKEQSDSLIVKLNLKSIENEDLKAQIQDKIDLDPLAPTLLNNRESHIDYLKYTQEQADILQGIVEQAKAKQPLDNALDFACKHAKRIQELLVYVQDTCPNAIKLSEKKVESSKTLYSNTRVLSSTGLKSSSSDCRSKPIGNKKNDRILQTLSNIKKNKVEAQPRRVNKKNRVNEPICDANVKHTMLNANSQLICVKGKQCMYDANHDACFLDFVNDVNMRAKSKSKSKHNQLDNIWKPTGKVFTVVGYKWKPTGKLLTIVDSMIANNLEPNHNWGSTDTDVPSSSSLVNDRLSRLFSGIWTPDALNI
ncbi:hypothetical protein Tco_0323054 [Tanacetum coccineum]